MTGKASISTHVLNLGTGRPAAGVTVVLYGPDGGVLSKATTNPDGRVGEWGTDFELVPGEYQLVFEVGDWFKARGEDSFYSRIPIAFRIERPDEHYHVPLLMNAFGYSTYRGS